MKIQKDSFGLGYQKKTKNKYLAKNIHNKDILFISKIEIQTFSYEILISLHGKNT